MKVRLNGETWKIIRRSRAQDAPKLDGYVLRNKPYIYIDSRLRGKPLIETIIHELMHARWPDLDEQAVTEAAEQFASVLHRLGVRHVVE